MITLETINHNYDYELNNVINVFKPYLDKNIKYEIKSILTEDTCITTITELDTLKSSSKVTKTNEISNLNTIKKSLYIALSNLTNIQMPWGYLNGIRPTKIVHNYKEKGYHIESINSILRNDFCISREKTALMLDVAGKEEDILKYNDKNTISIYIGIPFCPTKCLYCSFTSYPIKKYKDVVDSYLDSLFKELEYIAKLSSDKIISSIYIGGGTPTSLNEYQFEKLLYKVSKLFNIREIKEYTIEAGRPDTINRKKLKLMKEYGVSRISINPQTMNEKTLQLIGRSHSTQDIIKVFDIARQEGHSNINMDLIMGLPKETKEDVLNTMKSIKKLNPENITVHTMAIKRASRLKEYITSDSILRNNDIEQMLNIAKEYSNKMDMQPYYMYRQKDIVGNFENLGYAKLGYESIYNVQMISEQQTILAAGSGAVTKIIDLESKKINRVPNVRNIDDYISRIDEMIDRKRLAILK